MKTTLTLTLILAIGLAGCNTTNPEHADELAEMNDSASVEVTTDNEQATLLPSPLQIAFLFKKAGLPFNDQIILDPGKRSQYESRISQTLNLGTYTSDLAYCVLNKQNQQSIEYFKTVRELTASLGIQGIFEKNDFIGRVEKNMNNEDSLSYIISDIQMELDQYMHENNLKSLTPVIFAGAWIESMHLASHANKNIDEKLSSRFSEQMIVLKALNSNLKMIPSGSFEGELLSQVITELSSIEKNYNELPEVKSYNENGNEDFKLEDSSIATLTKQINSLRELIIK